MCSFLFTNKEIEDLDYVNRYMEDRGPDSTNIVEVGDYTFIHNLLSISGEFTPQPFLNEERQIACVYNGEIYNYVEIRQELISLGHVFRTTGDTEVLAVALKQWGVDALDRLEGMWAFAVYDEQEGSLTLCRDRFGEKPLYYYIDVNGNIFFGSEIKYIFQMKMIQIEMVKKFIR